MDVMFEIRWDVCITGIIRTKPSSDFSWWRHQMETFSALLALCAGNAPVTGDFPSPRPVTWSVDVFFDQRLNKQLNKQSWGWWLEMQLRPLWRHCNVIRTLLALVTPSHSLWRHCNVTLKLFEDEVCCFRLRKYVTTKTHLYRSPCVMNQHQERGPFD